MDELPFSSWNSFLFSPSFVHVFIHVENFGTADLTCHIHNKHKETSHNLKKKKLKLKQEVQCLDLIS